MMLRELVFNKRFNALGSAAILSSVISSLVVLAGIESFLVCVPIFFVSLVVIYLTLMYIWRGYE